METKRERVKDEIIGWMRLEFGKSRQLVYEKVCDLADKIFLTLGIDEDEQDKP